MTFGIALALQARKKEREREQSPRRVGAAHRTASHPCPPACPADEILINVVNAAINTPPIYGAMRLMARQIMISTAEKKGIRWKANVADLERSEVGAPLPSLTSLPLYSTFLLFIFFYLEHHMHTHRHSKPAPLQRCGSEQRGGLPGRVLRCAGAHCPSFIHPYIIAAIDKLWFCLHGD